MTKHLDTSTLRALAKAICLEQKCLNCASLNASGWETLPQTFDQDKLEMIGTLRSEGEESWNEYHPKGTQIWSDNAPIALGYHPYNKCDIYECKTCGTQYLRYTEFGGYYIDQRIRELNPELITDGSNDKTS